MLPSDPVLLMSVINTKLRDYYASFEALCDDLDIDRTSIEEKLAGAGFHYDEKSNQFK